MPNPTGKNSRFETEPAYGAVQRLQRLTKAAPISGAPTAALNAPRRSQRQAVRGRRAAQVPPPAAPIPSASPPEQVPYNTQLAEIWRQLLGYTNDPLVQQYAAVAASQMAVPTVQSGGQLPASQPGASQPAQPPR